MKKRLLCAMLMICLLVPLLAVPAYASVSAVPSRSAISVDGEGRPVDLYLINAENNYVKVRDLAYMLSGTAKQFAVGYDDKAHTVSLTTGAPYSPVGGEMALGDDKSREAVSSMYKLMVDGRSVSLTVYLIGGSNYYKLRDLCYLLNVGVGYDEATAAIALNTAEDYVGATPQPAENTTAQPTTQSTTQPTSQPAKTNGKVVYLTFDDGPNGNTADILDILDKYNVKASFFLLGQNMTSGRKDELGRMRDSGHAIGLHSYTHDYDKVYGSTSGLLSEFKRCGDRLYELTTVKSSLIRLPYGSVPTLNKEKRDALKKAGYKYWDWDIDSEDSKANATSQKVIDHTISALKKIKNSAVVLFHDKKLTAGALPKILDYLTREGWEFRVITYDENAQNFHKDAW